MHWLCSSPTSPLFVAELCLTRCFMPALRLLQLVVALPPEEFAAADTAPLHGPTVAHIARARGLAPPGAA